MLSKTLFRPTFTALQTARFTRTLATTSEQAPPPSVASTNTPKPAQDAEAPIPSGKLPRLNETDEVKPCVRNVEFFADFAIRAAYYLNLPVSGPIPLPRIVERWTVPRSNFVHKKSQENFERITLRRLIQIKDGHPESVQLWLAFLRRHAFYGVGMKANVWDFDDLDVASGLDTTAEDVNKALEPYFAQFGQRPDAIKDKSMLDQINSERFLNPRSPMNEVQLKFSRDIPE
ncbi:37S ribosomal protein S10, mitochondrial [Talaromyces atroroseus]|uniref:Small ribosomal subunit protein uS10m n=1 Tax=Talaromyces atroroseus TaxID=1441469 RepID=A0A225AFR6_TALAT|nr:37S ribosomal protein S10, mitochondrial [Talaromyces atroroseus]OKL56924.1 37S ribosomal protein S10, mitochondrial [Talaromyces atroroseus]